MSKCVYAMQLQGILVYLQTGVLLLVLHINKPLILHCHIPIVWMCYHKFPLYVEANLCVLTVYSTLLELKCYVRCHIMTALHLISIIVTPAV